MNERHRASGLVNIRPAKNKHHGGSTYVHNLMPNGALIFHLKFEMVPNENLARIMLQNQMRDRCASAQTGQVLELFRRTQNAPLTERSTPLEAHRLSIRCEDYAKKTVSFLKGTTGSSAVVFTWHDSAEVQPPHVQIGADEYMIREYYEKYSQNDPLRLDLLVKNYASFETFSNAAKKHDYDSIEEYQPFLRKYNLVDEIDFVFWAGGKAVASAALLQMNTEDLKISPENLREMQQYLQYTFSFIPAIKGLDLRGQLISRYKLTAKEQTVAELMISGESNKSIAAMMDVELATVKTHVLHIFQKLEVNSRSKALALLAAA